MTRSNKDQQNKSLQHQDSKKKKFLSPLAKEKSNLTFTGETRLRKNNKRG